MKLNALERTNKKKSEADVLRRAGRIPSVLYSQKEENALISVSVQEFQAILRSIKPGRLSTSVFTLVIDGKERKVIVKDIQYHPTSYAILHLDFQELVKGGRISVKVPIACTGVADCVGVKLGGFLRQVKRTVKVECPSDAGAIPAEFAIDVKDLNLFQKKRLSEVAIPKGIKPLASMEEVIVVVAKR
jgi:large subunit ribosomal protein L25